VFRKIDFVLVYEEDKKDSLDNPGTYLPSGWTQSSL
jgi:hypothetical protein